MAWRSSREPSRRRWMRARAACNWAPGQSASACSRSICERRRQRQRSIAGNSTARHKPALHSHRSSSSSSRRRRAAAPPRRRSASPHPSACHPPVSSPTPARKATASCMRPGDGALAASGRCGAVCVFRQLLCQSDVCGSLYGTQTSPGLPAAVSNPCLLLRLPPAPCPLPTITAADGAGQAV